MWTRRKKMWGKWLINNNSTEREKLHGKVSAKILSEPSQSVKNMKQTRMKTENKITKKRNAAFINSHIKTIRRKKKTNWNNNNNRAEEVKLLRKLKQEWQQAGDNIVVAWLAHVHHKCVSTLAIVAIEWAECVYNVLRLLVWIDIFKWWFCSVRFGFICNTRSLPILLRSYSVISSHKHSIFGLLILKNKYVKANG